MNTEKVFTAFNKEGEEILLFRKDNDTYIDLNSDNNEIYNKENIDLKTLINITYSLKVLKHMPKKIIKKLYINDREKLIDTKKVLLGMKVTVENLKTTYHQSGYTWSDIAVRGLWEEWYYNLPVYNSEYNWNLGNKEYGLYISNGKIEKKEEYSFNVYKNLNSFNEYIGFYGKHAEGISDHPLFNNGMNYIYLTDKTLYNGLKENLVEKKLVYELANQVKKINIEGE